MGLFDFLKGPSPARLLDQLLDAVAARDFARFEELAVKHQEEVRKHFPEWRKLPPDVAGDPARAQRHAEGVMAIATHSAESLGHPELMELLRGGDGDNPLDRWDGDLARAEQQMGEFRYDEAAAVLEAVRKDAQPMSGSGRDRVLTAACAMLAISRLNAGTPDLAVEPASTAVALASAIDGDGAIESLKLLYEVHRWRGDSASAADAADRIVETDPTWKRQARIVRAGEPLNRVVIVVGERAYEVDEAPPMTDGEAKFMFRRNRVSLAPCLHHTRRGEEAGSAGRLEEALECFRRAMESDRFDPSPHYQSGLTHLLMGQPAAAAACYRACEALAPGWFQVRADRWMAEGIESGRIPAEAFEIARRLEDAPMEPLDRLACAEDAIERGMNLPIFHLHRGRAQREFSAVADAADSFRRGLQLEGDADVRTRLLLELAMTVDGTERAKALDEAVALSGNLTAAAMAAVMRRAQPR